MSAHSTHHYPQPYHTHHPHHPPKAKVRLELNRISTLGQTMSTLEAEMSRMTVQHFGALAVTIDQHCSCGNLRITRICNRFEIANIDMPRCWSAVCAFGARATQLPSHLCKWPPPHRVCTAKITSRLYSISGDVLSLSGIELSHRRGCNVV